MHRNLLFVAAFAALTFTLVTTCTSRAQEILANPGFETGFPGSGSTYPSGPAGTASTWTAGGSDISNRILPADWMIDNSGTADESQWVEAAGLGSGGSDHFLYIPAGNDLCVEPLFSSMSAGGLKAGTTYRFSVDLASADTSTASNLTASLTTQSLGSFARLYTDDTKTTALFLDSSVTALSGSGDDINGLNLGTITQPNLDAFSFNWTTYQFVFTTPLTYWDDVNGVQVSHSSGDVMTDVSLDVSNHVGGGGAFVVDNFSMQAVPEPTSALLLSVVGIVALTRRQRRRHDA